MARSARPGRKLARRRPAGLAVVGVIRLFEGLGVARTVGLALPHTVDRNAGRASTETDLGIGKGNGLDIVRIISNGRADAGTGKNYDGAAGEDKPNWIHKICRRAGLSE